MEYRTLDQYKGCSSKKETRVIVKAYLIPEYCNYILSVTFQLNIIIINALIAVHRKGMNDWDIAIPGLQINQVFHSVLHLVVTCEPLTFQ